MTAGSDVARGQPVTTGTRASARARDHRFFTGMAVAAALVVFVGFAPTYYLRSYFPGGKELTTLMHVHGVLSTGWILLFVAQTSLVGAGRTDIHRRLGLLGVALLPALAVAGFITALVAARNGVTPPGGPPPLRFLAIPLGAIATFVPLAALGLYYRRRSDTHKRLMLLATIAILMPAIARMRWLAGGGPTVAIGGTAVFVLVCMLYDRLAHGRVHPAFLWGGVVLLLSLPARIAISRTDAWLRFAQWLTG